MVLALALPARAQVVLGTVRDSTGRPVPLAHVFGHDSLSAFTVNVGTVTDSSGRYVLRLGSRVAYLGARRIGYSPERARALEWNGADTLRVDVVLGAIPYALPTVYVGSDACFRLDSLSPQSEARRLWEGAVATIAAREALLNTYGYTEHATHRSLVRRDSVRVYDTTYFHHPPRQPLAKNLLSSPLATYRAPSLRNSRPQVSMRSPGDRLLMHPQFFERFCFDDQAAATGEGMVEVRFRERGRVTDEVQVIGAMTFRGMPGPSRVTWEYFIKGKRIARAEQVFELVDVNGTPFPLVAMTSMSLLDPQTGAVTGEGSARSRYSGFTPISGPPQAARD